MDGKGTFGRPEDLHMRSGMKRDVLTPNVRNTVPVLLCLRSLVKHCGPTCCARNKQEQSRSEGQKHVLKHVLMHALV
jgi:hypothetical protein